MNRLIKRLDELNFVIGLFFTFLSIILWIGYFIHSSMERAIVLYTAIAFLVFGLGMILLKGKIEEEN